jgi:hypothetical protein
MTPKLKALSLIESMSFSKSKQMNYANGEMVDIPQNLYAKQCALIALRETVWGYLDQQPIEIQNYWKEVKAEIEKL